MPDTRVQACDAIALAISVGRFFLSATQIAEVLEHAEAAITALFVQKGLSRHGVYNQPRYTCQLRIFDYSLISACYLGPGSRTKCAEVVARLSWGLPNVARAFDPGGTAQN